MQSSPGDASTESSSHFLFASSSFLRLWSRRYRWVIGGVAFTTIFLFLFYSYGHQQPLPPSRTTASRPVDWSEFAYTQYVTNGAYLCNSVMFFEALHRLSSRADRVLMYPSTMLESEQDTSDNARLILKARDDYNAKLVPVTVQHRNGADGMMDQPYPRSFFESICLPAGNTNITSSISDLGRFVYQTPCFQPNSVQTCTFHRFRLNTFTTHG